jgi:hypothetical protein
LQDWGYGLSPSPFQQFRLVSSTEGLKKEVFQLVERKMQSSRDRCACRLHPAETDPRMKG